MLLRENVPTPVIEVLQQLQNAGYKAYLVGGCVRDMLRERTPKDFDIASNATPSEVRDVFSRTLTFTPTEESSLAQASAKVIPTGIQHGTVTVLMGGEPIEVTTFRSESGYVDGRHPENVVFHNDIVQDLARRDFTMNAMAWDPIIDEFVDPFNGRQDLNDCLVRCVGDAMVRFSEDGLRPIRAIRFATTMGFTLERDTEEAITKTTDTFAKVATERIQSEFVKILMSDRAPSGLLGLHNTGLLDAFMREADPAYFNAVGRAPKDLAVRMALLLNYNLNVKAIMTRLKFTTRTTEETCVYAMSETPGHYASNADIRRWMAKVGFEFVPGIVATHEAGRTMPDGLGLRIMDIVYSRPALTTKDLVMDGREVMAVAGIKPGPELGKMMKALLESVIVDPAANTTDNLTAIIRGMQ